MKLQFKLVTCYESEGLVSHDLDLDDHELDLDDTVLSKVKENINIWDKGEPVQGIIVDRFELDSDFVVSNVELVNNIANGKSFSLWSDVLVDFYSDWYQNWLFVWSAEESKWVLFNYECPYCNGLCPVEELLDSNNLCDGYAGDIDGLLI